MNPSTGLLLGGLASLLAGSTVCGAPTGLPDPRNFACGRLIPDEDYCDQPRLVRTRDGTWVCVMTTGPGHEGGAGQHVAATRSQDQGRSWSPLVEIEPAGGGRKSSYALALITPADRIYAFYCYNGDGVTALPDGRPIRDDMQGWFVYRWSDDQGRTWSERRRLPMRLTDADRNNDWQGRLQMFWAIGTPTRFDSTAIFGFTKLGRYLLQEGEGWFFRSDNVLTERDPDRLEWRLVPDGEHGVRAPEFGSVQEEHDVVALGGERLFCVYRTALGHAACTYSRDGGRSWEPPEALRYAPGGRVMKQPRACTKVWRTGDGRFLLWFHNNGTTTYNNGTNAGSRNIAWLSRGHLQDGRLHWAQPEIVAYVDGGLEGCSYPDLLEDGDRVFIAATQKTEARVMAVDPELLTGLGQQPTLQVAATRGLLLDLAGSACTNGAVAAIPPLPPLCTLERERTPALAGRGGFSVELAVRFTHLAPDQVLLDTRDGAGRGWVLRTTPRASVQLELSDGWRGAFWESDPGLLRAQTDHHLVAIVDGGPKVISFLVDGQLCDGGRDRLFGFGRFDPVLRDVGGARELRIGPQLPGQVTRLRLYGRALRTSEAVGNWRSLLPG